MNLSERCQALAQSFGQDGRMGFRTAADLEKWVIQELGGNALEEWITLPQGRAKAIPPASIYAIAASTLTVSARGLLLCSLILGSRVYVKLPSMGLPQLEKDVAQFPDELKTLVVFLKEHDREIMHDCEVVVVMGSDETVEEIHRQTHAQQRFLPYGHKISAGILPMDKLTCPEADSWAAKAVKEIAAYDQMGCLSPQAYLCKNREVADLFARSLAALLESTLPPNAPRDWDLSAAVFQARQEEALDGYKILASENATRWTVVRQDDGLLRNGPGGCFIRVIVSNDLPLTLNPWCGKLSSLSIASEDLQDWAERLAEFGVARVCRLGDLQDPPVDWRHDGAPRLAPFVRWIYFDSKP